MNLDQRFLAELLDTPSPTGHERAGQRVWANWVGKHADEVAADAYSSAWAIRRGSAKNGPTVMLEAHADEIGFAVKHIEKTGFLRVVPIGGSDRAIARARRVKILTRSGPVPAVILCTAIHLRDRTDDKLPQWHDLALDVGAADEAGVAALGIRVGDPIVYADGCEFLGEHRLCGRAVDNRIGGAVIAHALALVAEQARCPATLQALNATQEEIGGHGATMATYRLRPDLALVIDVCHATDTPGIEQAKHGAITLGGGPVLSHGPVHQPDLVQWLEQVAEAEGITVQHEALSLSSGTDTDSIFISRSGIPAALVSIPLRSMHTPVETVDLRDVEATARLLAAAVRRLEAGQRFGRSDDILGQAETQPADKKEKKERKEKKAAKPTKRERRERR